MAMIDGSSLGSANPSICMGNAVQFFCIVQWRFNNYNHATWNKTDSPLDVLHRMISKSRGNGCLNNFQL